MSYFYTFIAVTWLAFWLYWLGSAARAKRSRNVSTKSAAIKASIMIVILVLTRLHWLSGHDTTIHSRALKALGTALLLAGLGLAVWARVHLGRNWGMPMTKVDDRELITTGPYRFVRHPIYSGLLLAMAGTGLATTLYWLIIMALVGCFFVYSAFVEERMMASEFPKAYPAYKARTSMLIPFVF